MLWLVALRCERMQMSSMQMPWLLTMQMSWLLTMQMSWLQTQQMSWLQTSHLLLWLQGHCCCCTRYMFPVYLEEGPHLKKFRADLQNTWVWSPGMALDGSGLQNKAGRWS